MNSAHTMFTISRAGHFVWTVKQVECISHGYAVANLILSPLKSVYCLLKKCVTHFDYCKNVFFSLLHKVVFQYNCWLYFQEGRQKIHIIINNLYN